MIQKPTVLLSCFCAHGEEVKAGDKQTVLMHPSGVVVRLAKVIVCLV